MILIINISMFGIMNYFKKVNSKVIPECNQEQLSWVIKDVNYSNDRILYILKKLYENGFKKINENETRILNDLLEELIDIISLQDNSKYIIKIGGLNILLGLIWHSKTDIIIKKVSILLVDLSSKNLNVQNYLTDIGVFNILSYVKNENTNKNYIESYVKIIYSVVVGNNIYSKEKFIIENGLEIIFSLLLKNDINNNIFNKSANLWIDLWGSDSMIFLNEKYPNNKNYTTFYCTKYIGFYQKYLFNKIKFINKNIKNLPFNYRDNYIKLIHIFINKSFEIKNYLDFFNWKEFFLNLKIFLSLIDSQDDINVQIFNSSNKIINLIKLN